VVALTNSTGDLITNLVGEIVPNYTTTKVVKQLQIKTYNNAFGKPYSWCSELSDTGSYCDKLTTASQGGKGVSRAVRTDLRRPR